PPRRGCPPALLPKLALPRIFPCRRTHLWNSSRALRSTIHVPISAGCAVNRSDWRIRAMLVAQLVIQKLLAAAVLAAGVYIVAQEMGYWADRMPIAVPQSRLGAYAAGIGLAVVGLIALLPPLRLRRKTGTISFPGEHGDVLIHLDSVEAN